MFRRTGFTLSSLLQAAVLAAIVAPVAAAEPATQSSATVTLDVSDAPQMAAIGERARQVVQNWLPRVAAALPSAGFSPPRHIAIVFRHDYHGVAECSDDRITASADYFIKHPDDLGAFVHELTHAVQAYGNTNTPGWLTEGIADYVRFYLYEPPAARPRVDAAQARYDGSYRVTAEFLDWCQRTHNPSLVQKLNAFCRSNRYDEAIWKKLTGKSLTELGQEWKASLATQSQPK